MTSYTNARPRSGPLRAFTTAEAILGTTRFGAASGGGLRAHPCAHTLDTLQCVAVRSTPVDAGANHLGEFVAGSSLHVSTHLLKDDGVGLLNRRIERSALGRRLDEREVPSTARLSSINCQVTRQASASLVISASLASRSTWTSRTARMLHWLWRSARVVTASSDPGIIGLKPRLPITSIPASSAASTIRPAGLPVTTSTATSSPSTAC